jgi:hypothetical protein
MSQWTGAVSTDWNDAGNWTAGGTGTGVPSATVDAIFSGTPTRDCVLGANRTCRALTFTGYTSTVDFATFTLTANNNITFQADQSSRILGTGTLAVNATSTLTSNGGTWPITIQIGISTPITITLGSATTTVQNIYVSSGSVGQIQTINSNTLNILGNLTLDVHLAGTTQINLTGTGTWNANNTVNAEVRTKLNINTSGTITRGANGYFYSGAELKYTSGTLSNGSANLGLSRGGNTSAVISNGVNWGNIYIYQNTTTLSDDMNINNFEFSFNSATLNGNNLRINGNINLASGGQVLSGTTVLQIVGTGSQSWTGAGPARISTPFVINKPSGTLSLFGALNFSGSSFTHTAGLVNSGSSTLTLVNNSTFNTGTMSGSNSWNNFTINASITLTLSSTLNVNGTLLCNGSTTFAGTSGFSTSGFSCITAGSTLTFQNATANPSASYVITGALIITGTAASRIILQAAGSASFTGIANGTALTYSSGTIPTSGMTISQATGIAPTGFLNLLPNRPTITGGTSPNFTISPSVSPTTGSIAMRAGYKAIFTLANNGIATQNVAYAQTQDINSNAGQTILSFGSNGDDTATNTALFRTLNWGPLIAPSGSVYYTFVN